RMTMVIKGEFEKIKDVKVEDVSLTCDTPLEVFNNEVNRLSRMDDDLFTYEVNVANILCDSKMDDDSKHEADDDMGYDPSDVAFTECNWVRGDDEVELTDEESSDDKDEVAEVFRIDTNLFNFETLMCKAFKEFYYLLQIDPDLLTKDIEGFKTYEDYKNNWIYEWNKDVPWVDEKHGLMLEFGPNPHQLNILASLSTIRLDVQNGQHVVGRIMDTVMEETYPELTLLETNSINRITNGDDESLYEQERRWNIYTNYDDAYEINHEKEELCEVHELPVCNIRRYMMSKYSFNNDEEYVAIKEDEYDDPTITREEAC
ncbi:hypothetical protein Tco_1188382, partial [Tanacetum coccineum]